MQMSLIDMPANPPSGQFSILYFASAATYTKKSSEFLPAPLKVSHLFDTLESRYPGMKQKVLSSSALTINLQYVDIDDESRAKATSTSRDLMIRDGDEVAIIPPVSSG